MKSGEISREDSCHLPDNVRSEIITEDDGNIVKMYGFLSIALALAVHRAPNNNARNCSLNLSLI